MSDAVSAFVPEKRPPEEQFAKNLEYVGKINPQLANDLRTTPLVNLNLAPNKDGFIVGNGYDVATQQWVPLCNPNEPWGEAEVDADNLWTPDAKIFCMFGFGLGYFASAMARRILPYQRLAIFETRPYHYAAACRCVDMSFTLGEGGRRIDVLLGDNLDAALQNWWLSFESHEKFFIAPPIMAGFTQQIDQAIYAALMGRCVEMHRYHQVGLATWAQFGRLIGDNDLENLPEYCISPGMQELADIWQGRPAVCIAAGPSLEKNLHWLTVPELRQKVCVITVGTTYALLRALGIEPDIVTTIDFQRLNWSDQFLNIPLDDHTPLVYLHSTWPSTPRRWPGPRFVALNASDTTGWLATYCKPKATAAQVQTVAHLNLVVAGTIGANPIILMGQDLSMPIESHHASGARVQDLSPSEAQDSHVQVQDYQGEPCWSRHSYLSMRTVFDQIIAAATASKTTIINCTEGGLALAGAENRTLYDVLKAAEDPLPGQLVSAKHAIQHHYNKLMANQHTECRWQDLRTDLQQLKGQVVLLQETAQLVQDKKKELDAGDLPIEAHAELESKILLQDQVFSKHPIAFSQYAVRSFPMVEVLSRIPPKPDSPQTDQRAFMLNRLVDMSGHMVATAPEILKRIDAVVLRLADLEQSLASKNVTRKQFREYMRRQSYVSVKNTVHKLPAKDRYTALVELLYQQQCYQQALTMIEIFGLAQERIAQRCRERIAAYENSMQSLRVLYYGQGLLTARGVVSSLPASTNGQQPTQADGETADILIEELTHGNSD